jgi:hypothetical protein
MRVAQLIEILQECDPQSEVAFVEGDTATVIDFVEQKVGNLDAEPSDPSRVTEVFLYEGEPNWADYDAYKIKTLAAGKTFAKNIYTKLESD